jgi:hypothetical protein
MAATAVLAIVVAAGQAHSAATTALVAAAREAVEPAATVRVSEAAPPSDSAVLRVEAELDALAAASLVWDDDARLRARTRVHVASTDRWINREITFAEVDTESERGRALGFTIASMLPEGGADIEITLPDTIAGRDTTVGRHALGIAVVGATGVGGVADGVGGSVDGQVFVADHFSLRAGLIGRAGAIGSTDPAVTGPFSGTDVVFGAAAGVVWWPAAPSLRERFGLGLRGDLLALRHQVFMGGPDNRTAGRMVPGLDVVAQTSVLINAGFELLIGVGGEVAFGNTAVRFVNPSNPAASPTLINTIPVLRPVGEAGLRIRF